MEDDAVIERVIERIELSEAGDWRLEVDVRRSDVGSRRSAPSMIEPEPCTPIF